MSLKLLLLAALCLTACALAGCAGTLPQRKAVERPPTITEEDIRADTPVQPADQPPSTQEPGPVTSQPQSPAGIGSGGDQRQLTDPSERQPRRFRWKDERGGRRGWEPAQPPR